MTGISKYFKMSVRNTQKPNTQKRVVKKKGFRRLVNITDDQKKVCSKAADCIYELDKIQSYMENIVEGYNQGDTKKIKDIKRKLKKISLLVLDV